MGISRQDKMNYRAWRREISARIADLGGFVPIHMTARKQLLPLAWSQWKCYACKTKFTVGNELAMLLRDKNVPLKEFIEGGAVGSFQSRFLCAECFEDYKAKFKDELLALRLAGEI